MRDILASLYEKAKQYTEFNDEIIEKLFQLNKRNLVLIIRTPEEYINGYRSKTRIFLAIISQLVFIITSSRLLICALINVVSLFSN